ncbi:MAG: hypothetical protein FD126_411 [Elusimicrobia bacterium]|nr:MAG: hypothetical protein FD126_411 [Elusimicrobiota bacterium]
MRLFSCVRGRNAAGRRARSARRGYTLVETLVAVMLISVVVTSVFSLVLTAKMGSRKTGKKAEALFYVQQYRELLKSYVTADTSVAGPAGGWNIPGDSCGCYALQTGVQHNLTSKLPPSFTAAPVNGQLFYTVTDVPCGTGLPCKSVQFNVSWQGL